MDFIIFQQYHLSCLKSEQDFAKRTRIIVILSPGTPLWWDPGSATSTKLLFTNYSTCSLLYSEDNNFLYCNDSQNSLAFLIVYLLLINLIITQVTVWVLFCEILLLPHHIISISHQNWTGLGAFSSQTQDLMEQTLL